MGYCLTMNFYYEIDVDSARDWYIYTRSYLSVSKSKKHTVKGKEGKPLSKEGTARTVNSYQGTARNSKDKTRNTKIQVSVVYIVKMYKVKYYQISQSSRKFPLI